MSVSCPLWVVHVRRLASLATQHGELLVPINSPRNMTGARDFAIFPLFSLLVSRKRKCRRAGSLGQVKIRAHGQKLQKRHTAEAATNQTTDRDRSPRPGTQPNSPARSTNQSAHQQQLSSSPSLLLLCVNTVDTRPTRRTSYRRSRYWTPLHSIGLHKSNVRVYPQSHK